MSLADPNHTPTPSRPQPDPSSHHPPARLTVFLPLINFKSVPAVFPTLSELENRELERKMRAQKEIPRIKRILTNPSNSHLKSSWSPNCLFRAAFVDAVSFSFMIGSAQSPLDPFAPLAGLCLNAIKDIGDSPLDVHRSYTGSPGIPAPIHP